MQTPEEGVHCCKLTDKYKTHETVSTDSLDLQSFFKRMSCKVDQSFSPTYGCTYLCL